MLDKQTLRTNNVVSPKINHHQTHTLTYENNNKCRCRKPNSYVEIQIKKIKNRGKILNFLMGMPPIVQEIIVGTLEVYFLPLTQEWVPHIMGSKSGSVRAHNGEKK